jgi:signal transduction histidine kinase
MLATLFVIAIGLDPSQPTHAPPALTYALLGAYVLFSAAIIGLTWDNWRRDARLAGPAHAVDILLFTALVLLTEGYTSPFYPFFMFLLLSAAIRWGWHATALTAILLTLLYLVAGLLVLVSGEPLLIYRFLVRTGHLVILSTILIWFGANQRVVHSRRVDRDSFPQPSLDESPFETGLRAAMHRVGAENGAFAWRDEDRHELNGFSIRNGDLAPANLPDQSISPAPFLYNLEDDRALEKDAERNLVEFAASKAVASSSAASLGLMEGLAIPVRSDRGEGMLFLDGVPGLAIDHIDLGEQIASDVASHLQRHALLRAVEESAEARSRLNLARDLHDSVVQFVAGAAFRLEAMKRARESGRDIEPELDELKQLMMQEQHELRSFITALRSGPMVALNDLAKELRALAERLSHQWNIKCEFSAAPTDMMIPARLRLDIQQLMREAVANAVRHAQATSVTIELRAVAESLQLAFSNDGAMFPKRDGRLEMPSSIQERVTQAGGTLDVGRGMGVTVMTISLPIGDSRS